eukprot:scaffold8921_cov137-Isochrysis_galbana.AAC.9
MARATYACPSQQSPHAMAIGVGLAAARRHIYATYYNYYTLRMGCHNHIAIGRRMRSPAPRSAIATRRRATEKPQVGERGERTAAHESEVGAAAICK